MLPDPKVRLALPGLLALLDLRVQSVRRACRALLARRVQLALRAQRELQVLKVCGGKRVRKDRRG